jgi:hypothetical protein
MGKRQRGVGSRIGRSPAAMRPEVLDAHAERADAVQFGGSVLVVSCLGVTVRAGVRRNPARSPGSSPLAWIRPASMAACSSTLVMPSSRRRSTDPHRRPSCRTVPADRRTSRPVCNRSALTHAPEVPGPTPPWTPANGRGDRALRPTHSRRSAGCRPRSARGRIRRAHPGRSPAATVRPWEQHWIDLHEDQGQVMGMSDQYPIQSRLQAATASSGSTANRVLDRRSGSAVCTDGSSANPKDLAAAARSCQTDGSTRPLAS